MKRIVTIADVAAIGEGGNSYEGFLEFRSMEDVRALVDSYAKIDESAWPSAAVDFHRTYSDNDPELRLPLYIFYELMNIDYKSNETHGARARIFNNVLWQFELVRNMTASAASIKELARVFGAAQTAKLAPFLSDNTGSVIAKVKTKNAAAYDWIFRLILIVLFKPLVVQLLATSVMARVFESDFKLRDGATAFSLFETMMSRGERYIDRYSFDVELSSSVDFGRVYEQIRKIDVENTTVRYMRAEDVLLSFILQVHRPLLFNNVVLPAEYVSDAPDNALLSLVYVTLVERLKAEQYVRTARVLLAMVEYYKNWIVLSNVLLSSQTKRALLLLRKSPFIEMFYPTYFAAEHYYFLILQKREMSFLQYGVPLFFLDDAQKSLVSSIAPGRMWTWTVDMLHHCHNSEDDKPAGRTFYDGWPNLNLKYDYNFARSVDEGVEIVDKQLKEDAAAKADARERITAETIATKGNLKLVEGQVKKIGMTASELTKCHTALAPMKILQNLIREVNSADYLVDGDLKGSADERVRLLRIFKEAQHSETKSFKGENFTCFFPLEHYPVFYDYSSFFGMWAQTVFNYVQRTKLGPQEFCIVCQNAEYVGPMIPYTDVNDKSLVLNNLFTYYPGYLIVYYNAGIEGFTYETRGQAMIDFALDIFDEYLSSSIVEKDADLPQQDAAIAREDNEKDKKKLVDAKKMNERRKEIQSYLKRMRESGMPFFDKRGVFWTDVVSAVIAREKALFRQRQQTPAPDPAFKSVIIKNDKTVLSEVDKALRNSAYDKEQMIDMYISNAVRAYASKETNLLQLFTSTMSVSADDDVMQPVLIQSLIRLHAYAYDRRSNDRNAFRFRKREFENLFEVANFYITHRVQPELEPEEFVPFVIRKNLSMMYNENVSNTALEATLSWPEKKYVTTPMLDWLVWVFDGKRAVVPIFTLQGDVKLCEMLSFDGECTKAESETNFDRRMTRNVVFDMIKKNQNIAFNSTFYRHASSRSTPDAVLTIDPLYKVDFATVLLAMYPSVRQFIHYQLEDVSSLLAGNQMSALQALVFTIVKRRESDFSEKSTYRFKTGHALKEQKVILVNAEHAAPSEDQPLAIIARSKKRDDERLRPLFDVNVIFLENLAWVKQHLIDPIQTAVSRIDAVNEEPAVFAQGKHSRSGFLQRAARNRIYFLKVLNWLSQALDGWLSGELNGGEQRRIWDVKRVMNVLSILISKKLAIKEKYYEAFNAVDLRPDTAAMERQMQADDAERVRGGYSTYTTLSALPFFIDLLRNVRQMYLRDVFVGFDVLFVGIVAENPKKAILTAVKPDDLVPEQAPATKRPRISTVQDLAYQADDNDAGSATTGLDVVNHLDADQELNEEEEEALEFGMDQIALEEFMRENNRHFNGGAPRRYAEEVPPVENINLENTSFPVDNEEMFNDLDESVDFRSLLLRARFGGHVAVAAKMRVGALLSSQAKQLPEGDAPALFVLPYHVNWFSRMDSATKDAYLSNPSAPVVLVAPQKTPIRASCRLDRDLVTFRTPHILLY